MAEEKKKRAIKTHSDSEASSDEPEEEKVYLEVEVYQLHNLVYGRIIKQDKGALATHFWLKYRCDNGWTIESSNAPELCCKDKRLYVRGTSPKNDNLWFCTSCASPDEAQQLIGTLAATVREFNLVLRAKEEPAHVPFYSRVPTPKGRILK